MHTRVGSAAARYVCTHTGMYYSSSAVAAQVACDVYDMMICTGVQVQQYILCCCKGQGGMFGAVVGEKDNSSYWDDGPSPHG